MTQRQDRLQDHPEALQALFELGRSWAESELTRAIGEETPFESAEAFGALWSALLDGDSDVIELLRELDRPERDFDEAIRFVAQAGYDLLPDELVAYLTLPGDEEETICCG
ncbi:hypothetical protein [Desertibaculum subflavum]|uniref:hypothetical protein n=1 Tax=Desertibaculum subflavum TaxID=2268458 RepID=UPI0013C41DDC